MTREENASSLPKLDVPVSAPCLRCQQIALTGRGLAQRNHTLWICFGDVFRSWKGGNSVTLKYRL